MVSVGGCRHESITAPACGKSHLLLLLLLFLWGGTGPLDSHCPEDSLDVTGRCWPHSQVSSGAEGPISGSYPAPCCSPFCTPLPWPPAGLQAELSVTKWARARSADHSTSLRPCKAASPCPSHPMGNEGWTAAPAQGRRAREVDTVVKTDRGAHEFEFWCGHLLAGGSCQISLSLSFIFWMIR